MLRLFDTDKAGHYIAGSVIAAVAAIIATRIPALIPVCWLIAFLAALIAGVLKEGADFAANQRAIERGETPPHQVERNDILATALGSLPVAAPLLVLQLMAIGVIR